MSCHPLNEIVNLYFTTGMYPIDTLSHELSFFVDMWKIIVKIDKIRKIFGIF